MLHSHAVKTSNLTYMKRTRVVNLDRIYGVVARVPDSHSMQVRLRTTVSTHAFSDN
jgi:hypothetical protein